MDLQSNGLQSFAVLSAEFEPLEQVKKVTRLNIGGSKHEIMTKSLLKHPETRLGHLASAGSTEAAALFCDYYSPHLDEFFFDRSAKFSEAIIQFYRTGELHIPDIAPECRSTLTAELKYWKIRPTFIGKCCRKKLPASIFNEIVDSNANEQKAPPTIEDGLIAVQAAMLGVSESELIKLTVPSTHPSSQNCGDKYTKLKSYIWVTLEDPASSKVAIVFMAVSCAFILLTIVALLMGSLDAFKYKNTITNATQEIDELVTVDKVCVGWFTTEWIARFWTAPDRMAYAKTPMSIIDVLSVIPFYIEFLVSVCGLSDEALAKWQKSMVMIRILRILRVLRVLRVLKVARYSKGFQSMGKTLKRSWRELIMMVMFMITTNIMFSTALYFIEGEIDNTKFTSIPAASWWCIITMTTVGKANSQLRLEYFRYGDITPTTPLGKLTASIASITGIILLAFPISVVVQNFDEEYNEDEEPLAAGIAGEDKDGTGGAGASSENGDVKKETDPVKRRRAGGIWGGNHELKSTRRNSKLAKLKEKDATFL